MKVTKTLRLSDRSASQQSTGYYNHGHNILRLFDILPNVPFTTSETKDDY